MGAGLFGLKVSFKLGQVCFRVGQAQPLDRAPHSQPSQPQPLTRRRVGIPQPRAAKVHRPLVGASFFGLKSSIELLN